MSGGRVFRIATSSAVDGVGDRDGVAVGLLHDVHEDRRPAVGGDDVVGGLLPGDDGREVLDQDGRALHNVDHGVLDLLFVAKEAGDRGQVEVVVLLDHPRSGDGVGVAEGVHDPGQRQAVPVEPPRVDEDVVLGPPSAHDASLGDAGQAVESRRDVVVGPFPELGEAARGGGDAEADHRKDGEGEAANGEARRGRQARQDLGDLALHEVQRVQDVDVPAEEDVDLGGAAAGGRAHVGDPGDEAHLSLDGAGHGHHLDVHRRDAVVGADGDAGEVGLRKDRDRQAEDEDGPAQREAQGHEEERPPVGLDELREAVRHCASFAASSVKVTSAPSGRP